MHNPSLLPNGDLIAATMRDAALHVSDAPPTWTIRRPLRSLGRSLSRRNYNARKRELLGGIVTQFPNSILLYDLSPATGGFVSQWAEPFKDHWVVPADVRVDDLDKHLEDGGWWLFYAHPQLTIPLDASAGIIQSLAGMGQLLKVYNIAYLLTADADNDPWTIRINPEWLG